ncbi:MAG: hypothetical protein ABSE82_16825 [Nitrososphaerales archaeon]
MSTRTKAKWTCPLGSALVVFFQTRYLLGADNLRSDNFCDHVNAIGEFLEYGGGIFAVLTDSYLEQTLKALSKKGLSSPSEESWHTLTSQFCVPRDWPPILNLVQSGTHD